MNNIKNLILILLIFMALLTCKDTEYSEDNPFYPYNPPYDNTAYETVTLKINVIGGTVYSLWLSPYYQENSKQENNKYEYKVKKCETIDINILYKPDFRHRYLALSGGATLIETNNAYLYSNEDEKAKLQITMDSDKEVTMTLSQIKHKFTYRITENLDPRVSQFKTSTEIIIAETNIKNEYGITHSYEIPKGMQIDFKFNTNKYYYITLNNSRHIFDFDSYIITGDYNLEIKYETDKTESVEVKCKYGNYDRRGIFVDVLDIKKINAKLLVQPQFSQKQEIIFDDKKQTYYIKDLIRNEDIILNAMSDNTGTNAFHQYFITYRNGKSRTIERDKEGDNILKINGDISKVLVTYLNRDIYEEIHGK